MKKNNTIFFLVLATLLVTALAALYYQYQSGQWAEQISDQAQQEYSMEEDETDYIGETETAETDPELETMPTVSEDNELETILEELEETVILEEDLSDL